MAAAAPNTTSLYMLEQVRQTFWSQNAHLSEAERQQYWMQQSSTVAQQTPRSMSQYNMTQLPTSNLGSMDRTHSAPASVAIQRSLSAAAQSNTSNCQYSHDERANDYALYPESASTRRPTSTFHSIAESSPFDAAMVEYTPDEYVSNCIEPSSSPSLPHNSHQPQLQVQLTPNSQWIPSLDGSTSPSTPSTALMTPVTQSGNYMSRQSSNNPLFFDDLSMMRVQSDSSSLLPLLPEDGSISFPVDVQSKPISSVDNSNFFSFTGSPSETFPSPAHVPASASALASSEQSPYLAEDMRRSASTSSESDASNASASSNYSRHSRRDREVNAQAASRKIAPKAVQGNDETGSASSNVQMVRIRSEDGSSKDVGVIAKAPYIRPQHPKIQCPHCSERPDGFRGTHELDRHIARAHATKRKGFICVDASPKKNFLANCKHCRNRKVYGAYYNAAAHLRRAHFHPRKRGRKGKHDEKRGGIGGGDDPPMEYLKQHWIQEIEVENNTRHAPPPERASDSVEPINTSFDSSFGIDPTQSQQETMNSMTQPIDPNAFMPVDISMFANPSEPMYDMSQFAYSTSSTMTDMHNFQFDAYNSGMPQ